MINKIAEIAASYVGQTEVGENEGFEDKVFETKMKAVGFVPGNAWCVLFAELVWQEAGQDTSYFSTNAVRTWKFHERAGYTWSTIPVPGALAIYRRFKDGEPQAAGHVGIVTKVRKTTFDTVEGNTTAQGSREGKIVAQRIGKSYKWNIDDGLRLMGFVHPK